MGRTWPSFTQHGLLEKFSKGGSWYSNLGLLSLGTVLMISRASHLSIPYRRTYMLLPGTIYICISLSIIINTTLFLSWKCLSLQTINDMVPLFIRDLFIHVHHCLVITEVLESKPDTGQ